MAKIFDRSDKIDGENSPLPLYEQVRQDLLDRLQAGEWSPGDALPPEMDLTESYGVSRVTIRRAISELARAGYLFRRSGKGTFVRERMQYYIPNGMLGFPEHASQMGEQAQYQVVKMEICPVPPAEADLLQIEAGTSVRHLILKRLIDHKVVGWQEIYVLEAVGDALNPEEIEAYQEKFPILNLTGLHIAKRIARMRARRANKDDAAYLSCQEGDPILFLEVLSFQDNNLPAAINRISHHGDLFEYYYNIISD